MQGLAGLVDVTQMAKVSLFFVLIRTETPLGSEKISSGSSVPIG